jgi:hypothetical protein
MSRRLFRFITVVVFGLSASTGVAGAQEATTGSIAGQIVDAQGLPMPGVTVTLSSDQRSRSVLTDAEGRFLAPFLTPGNYTVRAELSGFKPTEIRDVDVGVGQRAVVPSITLRIGGLEEQVEVVGAPPVVDTTTAGVGTTLDSDFLARVPVSRQFSDTLYLAPGVSSSGGAGRSNPSVSGASGLENQYVIDGINVTDSGYGALGSYSIIFGSLGTGVPFDFVKEVQVKTGGYEAEFGQATGGVVNAVTKSGSNAFRGTLFGYVQPEGLEGDYTRVVLPNATRSAEAVNTTASTTGDAGFEIGGPIWRDRAFFFGAFDPQWRRTAFTAPENFPLSTLGEVERERQAMVYSGKATWQPANAHRLDVSVFGDPSEGDPGPQRRSSLLRDDETGFSSLEFGGHNQTLRYEGVLGSNWLLSASFARATNYLREFPEVDALSVLDTTVTPNARRGGLGYVEDIDGENRQWQAKATYLWRGHELKVGMLFEDIRFDNIIDRTGSTFTLPDGTKTATGASITVFPDPVYGEIHRVTRANLSRLRETSQEYLSFFVQDTWKLGNHLTIKPGLRYEQQKLIGNLEDFTWDSNWAPRIGVVWDPTGQGRMKVFGNWGRYFAKVPNDLAARALSADAGVTRADYFDAALTQPVPDGTLAANTRTHFLTAGLSASEFDPDSKSTYSDEWLGGLEYEVVPGFSLAANYIHRSFGRVLEDVGTAPMVAYFLEQDAGSSVEYFITNPDADTPVAFPEYGASFEEAIHDYDAVTVSAEKRFGGRWGVQSSYRWSRLEGTFEGFFRNDNGQSDPAITSLFDFPTKDPSYAAIGGPMFGFRGDIRFLGEAGAGPLPLDRAHHIKVYGNYLFDMGLNVGVGISASSGTPLTAFAANPYYESDGEIPETPRGAGFETVNGFRDRTPWMESVDLHADYSVPLGGARRLILLADVFNVFDSQDVINYDNYTEIAPQIANPDFGRVIAYQTPRQVRVGLRLSF